MMYDGYSVEDDTTRIKMDDVVACVDCKHYLRTFGMWMGQTEARCLRTHEPTVNLVTGKVSKVDYYQLERCRRMRENGIGTCGKNGKFWTPRKETPEMTMKLLKRTAHD
jgi:hypothetical protein